MTTTFENAKEGDRVFCLVYGEGVITGCRTGLYVKFGDWVRLDEGEPFMGAEQ